jgi:hypothetical protein
MRFFKNKSSYPLDAVSYQSRGEEKAGILHVIIFTRNLGVPDFLNYSSTRLNSDRDAVSHRPDHKVLWLAQERIMLTPL